MKYKGMMVSLRLLMAAVFVAALSVQGFSFGFSEKDKDTMNLQTFIISDFGDEKDQSNNIIWKPRFSRYAKPSDVTKEMSGPDTKACNVTYVQARPLGIPQESDAKQKWALGVKAQFVKKGYNWIELVPSKTSNSILGADGKPNADQDASPSPLNLVGVVKSLDVWVWGGNYNYWIEFYLTDYKGYLHRLSAGDISYVGWRNMRTKVPDYIPQAEHHVPFLKNLKLEMVKLWAYPTERVDQFYAYFDYMQVQTDVYLERFNGDDLANNVW